MNSMFARRPLTAGLLVSLAALFAIGGSRVVAQRPFGGPNGAQNPRAARQAAAAAGQAGQRQAPIRFTVTGKVHSVAPGGLRMITDNNEPWEVKINDKTAVKVTGEADLSALRPGTAVRFYAQLDKRHFAQEPIEEITIFTPGPNSLPTLEVAAESEDESADGNTTRQAAPGGGKTGATKSGPNAQPDAKPPGVQSRPLRSARARFGLSQDSSQFELDSDAPQGARRPQRATGTADRDKSSEAETQRYFVAGTLRSVRYNKITVVVGQSGTVRGVLAKDARVKIDSTSIQIAQPGDDIVAEGWYVHQGHLTAKQIDIELRFGQNTAGPNRDDPRPRPGTERQGPPPRAGGPS